MILLTERPITTEEALKAVASPECGGIAVFVGTVRDDPDARPAGSLTYEAYAPMASQGLERIAGGIRSRHPEARVAILHRTGVVPVGEASVVIAVATAHRAEAFEECRQAIETLKKDVPIWKHGGLCCRSENGESKMENGKGSGRGGHAM